MTNNHIIQHLIKSARPFSETKTFSEKPGIYALFFLGSEFPLENFDTNPQTIIYIGKTEKSQISRDLKTHFASGGTGSSTIRRSLGALLRDSMDLNPIPRNDKDFDANRKSMFKFDHESEEKLTDWMHANLGLSFYEFEGHPSELDQLESLLISKAIPVLNIDSKNPWNFRALTIRIKRKATAELAFERGFSETKKERSTEIQTPKSSPGIHTLGNMHPNARSGSNKYIEIWESLLPQIILCLEQVSTGGKMFGLSKSNFQHVGNRSSYSFSLVLNNGSVSNNISGSAVARDLEGVLRRSGKALELLKGKTVKIRLDSSFNLHFNQL